MRKRRKSSRAAAVRAADKWFSLYIRLSTKMMYGKCVFCGKPIEHCFHFFSRSNYATRWEVDNAIGSCVGCNFRMEFDSWPFYEWYEKKFGREALDNLNRRHHAISKLSTQDILDIAERFKMEYEKLIHIFGIGDKDEHHG